MTFEIAIEFFGPHADAIKTNQRLVIGTIGDEEPRSFFACGPVNGEYSTRNQHQRHPTADQQYRAYGKQRDTGAVVTDHKFTGQKLDGTGLQYFNARYYDPAIGTFISPDTIVPDATSVFGYNRYMYGFGNPLKYNDPTGHFTQDEIESYLRDAYPDDWWQYLSAWMSDKVFWEMLSLAQIGDTLWAPTSPSLHHGEFVSADRAAFGFYSHQGDELYQYQGYGPYRLTDSQGTDRLNVEKSFSTGILGWFFSGNVNWQQPLYRYQKGAPPQYSGYNRKVSYSYTWGIDLWAGDSMPAGPELVGSLFGATLVTVLCPQCDIAAIGVGAAAAWGGISTATVANNAARANHILTVDLVDRRTWMTARCNTPCFLQGGPPPDESAGLLR